MNFHTDVGIERYTSVSPEGVNRGVHLTQLYSETCL